MAEPDNDKIVKTVEINAPIARVWKAISDHKEFGAWFRVDLDQAFEPGGISTGRITYPGHEGAPWVVYVERMDPERLFTFRWYDSESGETVVSQYRDFSGNSGRTPPGAHYSVHHCHGSFVVARVLAGATYRLRNNGDGSRSPHRTGRAAFRAAAPPPR